MHIFEARQYIGVDADGDEMEKFFDGLSGGRGVAPCSLASKLREKFDKASYRALFPGGFDEENEALLCDLPVFLVDTTQSGTVVQGPFVDGRWSCDSVRVPEDKYREPWTGAVEELANKFDRSSEKERLLTLGSDGEEVPNEELYLNIDQEFVKDIDRLTSEPYPVTGEAISMDMLGCYVYSEPCTNDKTAIFLWVDKIKECYGKDLKDFYMGGFFSFMADVLIHELGHALMDTQGENEGRTSLWGYLIEEPLANGLAVCLGASSYTDFAITQPFPYTFGLNFRGAFRRLRSRMGIWRNFKAGWAKVGLYHTPPGELFDLLICNTQSRGRECARDVPVRLSRSGKNVILDLDCCQMAEPGPDDDIDIRNK